MKQSICNFLLGFAIILNAQEKTAETYVSDAKTLQMEGRYQEAKDLLLEVVRIYPLDSDVHLQLGLAWAGIAQTGEATEDVLDELAKAMEALNKAFAEFEEAIRLQPGNFNAHFYFGAYGVDVPESFGKLDEGVTHLEKAKSLLEIRFPDGESEAFATLYRYLGQGYFLQGRYAEARAALEKVLELAPQSEDALAAQAGLESLKALNATSDNENETK